MPYGDPDSTDPMLFVGVTLPGSRAAVEDMAYAFAEEFARQGHGGEHILQLFRTPFYRGAYVAYHHLGEEVVQRIVAECVGVWGRLRFVDRDTPEEEPLLQIEMPS